MPDQDISAELRALLTGDGGLLCPSDLPDKIHRAAAEIDRLRRLPAWPPKPKVSEDGSTVLWDGEIRFEGLPSGVMNSTWDGYYLVLTFTPDQTGDDWVACSERLPEIGARVLCCDASRPPFYDWIAWRSYVDAGAWQPSGQYDGTPTHWRPLPPPPSDA